MKGRDEKYLSKPECKAIRPSERGKKTFDSDDSINEIFFNKCACKNSSDFEDDNLLNEKYIFSITQKY